MTSALVEVSSAWSSLQPLRGLAPPLSHLFPQQSLPPEKLQKGLASHQDPSGPAPVLSFRQSGRSRVEEAGRTRLSGPKTFPNNQS